MNKLKEIQRILKEKELTISTIESCTAGLLSNKLSLNFGMSNILLGSIVAYNTNIKISLLEIPKEEIERYGVVSQCVAHSMAKSGKKFFNSDIVISVTGYTGEGKNIKGKVIYDIFIDDFHNIFTVFVDDDRETNNNYICNFIFDDLYNLIK